MIICICRNIREEDARETVEKIVRLLPTLPLEKKLEAFSIEHGQPRCGVCREQILMMFGEKNQDHP